MSIFVTDPVLYRAVLAHEVSHYVDYMLGIAALTERMWYEDRAGYVEILCTSEGEAWRIYHAWLIYHRIDGYLRYDWLRAYPRCGPRHLR